MINLLKETLEDIESAKKSIEDIRYIGLSDGSYCCDWEDFEKIADFEYDNGWGGEEIKSNLIIVFKDLSRMIRQEYDGSEWWIHVPAENPRKENSQLMTQDDLLKT